MDNDSAPHTGKKKGCTYPGMESFSEHEQLTSRLKRTLYYSRMPTVDRPSLPLTELAVEFFQDASPRDLGCVDTRLAADVARKACMSPCSMMIGMLYIERLKKRNPDYLQTTSSADLFLLSMMMASKFLYDEGTEDEVFNDEWAESADKEVQDLNKLERNYLHAIDWSLFVSEEEFQQQMNKVECKIAERQGLWQGWYTYSDVQVLSSNKAFKRLVTFMITTACKVVVVCTVAYAAAVVSMVTATMVTMSIRQRLPPPSVAMETWWPTTPFTTPAIPTSAVSLPPHEYVASEDVLESVREESRPGVVTGDTSGRSRHGGLPGLITLAFIQETFSKFMGDIRERWYMENLMTSDQTKEAPIQCRPGCCLVGNEHGTRCWNTSRDADNMLRETTCKGCQRQRKHQARKVLEPSHPRHRHSRDSCHTCLSGVHENSRVNRRLGPQHEDMNKDSRENNPWLPWDLYCCCHVRPSKDKHKIQITMPFTELAIGLRQTTSGFQQITV